MTCDRTHQVSAYHDGELAAGAVAELERHLPACEACRDELASLRRLSAMVQSAAMDEPAFGSLQRWMRSSPRAAIDHSVRRLAGWMTAAAATVFVTATLSLMMRSAEATPVLGEWELAMVNPGSEPASQTVLLAQWMADDLSAGADTEVQP